MDLTAWIIIGAIWGYALGQLLVLLSVVFWEWRGARLWNRASIWARDATYRRWARRNPVQAATKKRQREFFNKQLREAYGAYVESANSLSCAEAEMNIANARRELQG